MFCPGATWAVHDDLDDPEAGLMAITDASLGGVDEQGAVVKKKGIYSTGGRIHSERGAHATALRTHR